MARWFCNKQRFTSDTWKRVDGVEIYRHSGRSWFRVHRPNKLGFGHENLTGKKGTALKFKTLGAAQSRADEVWPMETANEEERE